MADEFIYLYIYWIVYSLFVYILILTKSGFLSKTADEFIHLYIYWIVYSIFVYILICIYIELQIYKQFSKLRHHQIFKFFDMEKLSVTSSKGKFLP